MPTRFKYKQATAGIRVFLDGRKIGLIQQLSTGWRYLPGGSVKSAGDLFPSCALCVQSIEGDEWNGSWSVEQ